VGMRGSFSWVRPEHMVPEGKMSPNEIRQKLMAQRDECLSILNKLPNGTGTLFTANMSVAKIGRMDLYQWIYFLAQHARRHLSQLDSVYQEASSKR
jgi:DinB family protein